MAPGRGPADRFRAILGTGTGAGRRREWTCARRPESDRPANGGTTRYHGRGTVKARAALLLWTIRVYRGLSLRPGSLGDRPVRLRVPASSRRKRLRGWPRGGDPNAVQSIERSTKIGWPWLREYHRNARSRRHRVPVGALEHQPGSTHECRCSGPPFVFSDSADTPLYGRSSRRFQRCSRRGLVVAVS